MLSLCMEDVLKTSNISLGKMLLAALYCTMKWQKQLSCNILTPVNSLNYSRSGSAVPNVLGDPITFFYGIKISWKTFQTAVLKDAGN